MSKKDKHPGGRPSDYDEKYCQMLIDHMERGLSFESFAGKIRKAKQTLYNWIEAHPEFLDAKKIGESCSLLRWEETGIKGLSEIEHKDDEGKTIMKEKLNATVWIFNMKNRFGWRDRTEVTSVSSKTDEELIEEAKALIESTI